MKRLRKSKELPEEEESKDGIERFRIQELPRYILMDILSWLSVKSICRCRCVCKHWLHILSDPAFARLHLSRATACPILRDTSNKRLSRALYLVELERDNITNFDLLRLGANNMELSTIFVLPECESNRTITNVYFLKLRVVNSCNGLLCLRSLPVDFDNSHPAIFIHNPVTAEYSILPTTRPECNSEFFRQVDVIVPGLGFCPKTNRNKVLVIMCKLVLTSVPVALVYTLGLGPWRTIENPTWFRPKDTICPAFLNNALHWFVELWGNDNEKFILSFNFESQQFRALPAPPPFFQKKCSRITAL